MPFQLRQEYLVSYDIQNNKIRTKVFNELSKYGLRNVQKSVFWGYLTIAELNGTKRFLAGILQKEDKSFITHTSFNSRGYSYLIGHESDEFQDWEEIDVI